MFKSGFPQRLLCYGMPYLAKVMQRPDNHSRNLDGCNPIEKITGEKPEIYEHIDFGLYD